MSELASRKCPICKEPRSEPLFTKGELHLVRCTHCAMIFANPIPAEMATGAFYDHAGNEYLSADKLESDYAEVRFEREIRLLRSYCQRGSVLDVGCSSGGFLYGLMKRFPKDYKTLGTDVSQAPVEHAAKMGVPVVKEEFLSHVFNEQFDAVTFWAVVEHLFEPQSFVKKAAAVLKPNGLCFILVPNMQSLAVKILGAKYRYIFPEHINYFTPATLKALVEPYFEALEMRSMHFNPIVILKDLRSKRADIPRAERAKLLKRTNAYKQSRLMLPARLAYRMTESALGRFLWADNLVIICRKRLR